MSANLKLESDFSGVLDAASEIASRRRDLLIAAKRARMAEDVDLAFKIIDTSIGPFLFEVERVDETERQRRIRENDLDIDDDRRELLNALADMVNQFAYRIERKGKDTLCSGGLSALETAFTVLDLPDPCWLEEYWDKIDDRRYERWSTIRKKLKKAAKKLN